MKIIYVVGAYGARYIANEIHRQLVQEFARRGHQVVVYAGVTPGELDGQAISYHDGPVEVRRQLVDTRGRHKIAAELGRRVLHYPRFLPLLSGLRRVLAEHPDADVIHADSVYPIGAIAAMAASGHRAALVPTINGGDLIDYPGYGYGRFRLARRLTRWTFARSALVRTNSQLMAERAIELGCERAKLRAVIVNIGDRFFIEQPRLPLRRQQARLALNDQHGFDPSAPLLLSTGRLLPLKGFHDIVAAMAVVKRSCPDARLIIAGPNNLDPLLGDQHVALGRAIVEHGVERQVLLQPDRIEHDTEMARYLAAADVLVTAAHIDGLTRVVAEAGMQATPAIVTATTGIAPLVQQLEAGVVVPSRNPRALAEAMLELIDNPQQRERMGYNARRLAQRFRSAVIADQLLDLYRQANRNAAR